MCHWRKWIWPGIFTVVLLSALAVWLNHGRIQTELSEQASATLAAEGQGWATVEMDGRDAVLRGTAPSETAQADAQAIADATYDIRVVADGSELLAAQAPYTLTAERSGNTVALTGFVPDEATRATILANAQTRFPDASIDDQMVLARGAPDGLPALADFGFAQLSGIDEGRFALSDQAMSFSGQARDRELFDGINAELSSNLPAGALLAENGVTVPNVSPYTLLAERNADGVVLSGYVPSEEARAALLANATDRFDGQPIDDQTELAPGAPENFEELASFGLERLSQIPVGSFGLSDAAISLSGEARDTAGFDDINAKLSAELPNGATLAQNDVTAPVISPYVWGAEYDGNRVVLTGNVPDTNARDSIVAQAQSVLPGAEIVDEQIVGRGAAEAFPDAANFALAQLQRFSSGKVGLIDSVLDVEGIAADSQQFSAANDALNGELPAGLGMGLDDISPPTVSPYQLAAEYDGATVRLTGNIPDDDARERIRAAVASSLPQAKISDELQIAVGAPPTLERDATFGIAQLGRFASGSVDLTDQSLSIEGIAIDSAAYGDTNAALDASPEGLEIASREITAPVVSPYGWSADRRENTVRLEGLVPSEQDRARILARVEAAVPGASVEDNMTIASGAPSNFADRTDYGVDQMANFQSGSATLSDEAFSITGDAVDTEAYETALAAKAANAADAASYEVTPPTVSPYEWSATLDAEAITLEGYVPSTAVSEALEQEAREAAPGRELRNDLRIATGEPEGFEASALGAVGSFANLVNGSATLTPEGIDVTGDARSAESFAAVNGELDALSGIANRTIQPPAAAGAYRWSASKTGDDVLLQGYVPDQETRAAMLAQAKGSGFIVEDRMTLATGAPDDFGAAALAGIDGLAGFADGEASIEDQAFNIAGTASSVAAFERGLGSNIPPAGFTAGTVDMRPATVRPFLWQVVRGADKATITGFVPNRGLGDANVAAARSTLNSDVEDQQRVAAGAPEKFGNAAASALRAVSDLDRSSARIQDQSVTLRGHAETEAIADRVRTRINDELARDGFTLREQITFPAPPEPVPVPVVEPVPTPDSVVEAAPRPEPPPTPAPEPAPAPEVIAPEPEIAAAPATCNTDFAALFEGEEIGFETAKAVVSPASYPLLRRISKGLEGCDDIKIEIGGHTDSRGSERYNQALSQARARAVVDYLGSVGTNIAGLSAKGYGELQPLATNDTAEGRTKNRRIEFKVTQ
ncbi:OmpA family protein [Rhizobiaceae bacterium]|nr:OmpA family protein [Rhizobiaceae bacterium]